MRKVRPNTGLQHVHLFDDNAPAHKSSTVAQFMKSKKVSLLSHSPYSPDLAPCVFRLFPKLKNTYLLVGIGLKMHVVCSSQFLIGVP